MGDRLGKSDINLNSDVDGQKEIARYSLASPKLGVRFTSAELGVVSRTLDVALV